MYIRKAGPPVVVLADLVIESELRFKAGRIKRAPTPRSRRRSSTLRRESGKRTYSITAKRMTSGLVLN